MKKLKWKVFGGNILAEKLDQTRPDVCQTKCQIDTQLDPRSNEEIENFEVDKFWWNFFAMKYLPLKIFTPVKDSPLKSVHLRKVFTSEKYSPLIYFQLEKYPPLS